MNQLTIDLKGVVIAACIAVSFALGFFGYTLPAFLILSILIVCLLIWKLSTASEAFRHSFEGAAALLSSIAILSAAYWYIFERPGVPKIDININSKAWPVDGEKTLILLSVDLKNVGETVVSFNGEKGILKIGKMIPLDNRAIQSLSNNIVQKDEWPQISKVDISLQSTIEIGETEKLYYATLIPCEKNSVLTSMIAIPKRYSYIDTMKKERNDEYWIAQSVLDPIGGCKASANQDDRK